jgi:hypothetical protein
LLLEAQIGVRITPNGPHSNSSIENIAQATTVQQKNDNVWQRWKNKKKWLLLVMLIYEAVMLLFVADVF